MKMCIKSIPLHGMIAGLGLILAGGATAQTFTTLHSFTATAADPPYTNSDGANPQAVLILSGSTLYGTTTSGGSSGNGTLFANNADGTGFTILHSFTTNSGDPYYTNSDGAYPGGLILSGDTLYGTAGGGGSGHGTVFAVNTDGASFTTLHTFTAASGSGGLYGTN